MFRDFVPEGWRFWLILIYPIVFQMSDAVFMGLSTQISSDLSLLSEDILMCGFAGMIGVTMTFPLLFRLKFRFTTRQILLTCTLGMATLSAICLHIRFVPLMVALSLLFGMLKLWGSFEVFSSVMLKVAPRYNFAPFLSLVFTIVFGSIELSGIVSAHITHAMPWQYVNYLSIGALLLLALLALTCMRNFRAMPPQPLLGIGWMGLLLWSVMLLAFAFIFVYGSYLDWLHSPYMHLAIGIILITLGCNLWRMQRGRHPYLPFAAFRYHNLLQVVVLFLVACVMMSTESVLQHILTGEVLHFSAVNTTGIRLSALIGTILGGIVSTQCIEHLGWGWKRLTFLSFLLLTMYEVVLFTLVSPHTPVEAFYLPALLYGMGHVMVFVVLTTYIEGIVPFAHRFQVLTILGFVRIGCGSALGAAIFGHLFKGSMSEQMALLGSQYSPTAMSHVSSFGEAAHAVSQSAILVSLRDLFGLAAVIGIITLLFITMGHFKHNIRRIYPTLVQVYGMLRRSIAPQERLAGRAKKLTPHGISRETPRG